MAHTIKTEKHVNVESDTSSGKITLFRIFPGRSAETVSIDMCDGVNPITLTNDSAQALADAIHEYFMPE